MAWRLAGSLEVLRNQVNAAAPARSKISDGTIGDAAHAATSSDHNPDGNGVVKAMDLTHDPARGADMQKIADSIIASNDSRIWYIIFNYRIWERGVGWKPYYGSNPHDKHAHFNTLHSALLYDNKSNWNIGQGVVMTPDGINLGFMAGFNRRASDDEIRAYTGKDPVFFLQTIYNNNVGFRTKAANFDNFKNALDAAYRELGELKKQLAGGVSATEADALKKQIADKQAEITQQTVMIEALQKEKSAAVETGNLFTRWIGDLINKMSGVN